MVRMVEAAPGPYRAARTDGETGLWTEKFLNRAGRDAGLALRQFGYLAQATLH